MTATLTSRLSATIAPLKHNVDLTPHVFKIITLQLILGSLVRDAAT